MFEKNTPCKEKLVYAQKCLEVLDGAYRTLINAEVAQAASPYPRLRSVERISCEALIPYARLQLELCLFSMAYLSDPKRSMSDLEAHLTQPSRLERVLTGLAVGLQRIGKRKQHSDNKDQKPGSQSGQ